MINGNIQTLIPKIREFMTRQPVLRAWIFGSCSRGEETADSDIDIMVDFDEADGMISLFKMGGMLMDLSELLGRKVDLVERKGLLNFAQNSVDNDKILIYERPA